MPDPLVDVLIPVHNNESTIRDAVASIQCQDLAELRIVVVDDGSTDATPVILEELARADRRILVLHRPKAGLVEALNFGLGFCTAPLLARHDGDDLAGPDRLQRQVAFLRDRPGCVAVSSLARHIDNEGRPLGTAVSLRDPAEADPLWTPSREPYLLHPFLMVHRDAMRQVGGYRHVLLAEDTDLYWRLQEVGSLHGMADLLGDYRMHVGSTSSRSVRQGRVMALSSQLAGLSALRRRAGQEDLVFDQAAASRYADAESLGELLAVGGACLTAEERTRLAPAMAAKLVELASYRPFELEVEDCRFIRRAFAAAWPGINRANQLEINQRLTGTALRLMRRGRLRELQALFPGRHAAGMAGRIAFRLGLPTALRTAIKTNLRGRGRDRPGPWDDSSRSCAS